jgi:polyvinyl alcohol dehydrogenase (cytochrome)
VFTFFHLTGHDYDIGASPNLFRIGGRAVVGVGDKGGRYAVFDALTGKTVWRRDLCPGSHLGGVMTSAAVSSGSIWVTCNRLEDTSELAAPSNRTLVVRLSAQDGRTEWTRSVVGGTVGAVNEAGRAVFVPNTLGTVQAFDARTGRTLWSARPAGPSRRYDHGVAGGITVADDRVLVPYGYAFLTSVPPAQGPVGGLVAYGIG